MIKFIARIAQVIVLIIKFFVIIRFTLKLLNANEENPYVMALYQNTNIILEPLTGMVQESIQVWRFTLEFTSLIAIFFLIIISYILREIIKTFSE